MARRVQVAVIAALVGCGARTSLPLETDGGTCNVQGAGAPAYLEPGCVYAEGRCVNCQPWVGAELACSMTCTRPEAPVACVTKGAIFPVVGCVRHLPTGRTFLVGAERVWAEWPFEECEPPPRVPRCGDVP